ncbi:MAG: putative lipid II flippase FtsW [Elusimicrobiota bacterium]|jgi:cell division protein FtsW
MIPRARRRDAQSDYGLLLAALLLLGFGLMMMWSASAILADQQMHDSLFFLKRQGLFAAVGLMLMAFFARTDYHRLRGWVWPAFFVSVLLLAAVLFMPPVAGVRRWIRLGPFGLQPAEFAKLSVILFIADFVDRKKSRIGSPLIGLLVPLGVVAVPLVLMGLEPDLGTPALIFATVILTLFIGGARVSYVLGAILAAVPIVIVELLRKPYRRKRLLTFLDPFEQAQGAGYQLAQSLIAVGSGGWFGKGLGASQLKLMYLPAPHTDFIFPIVCEELGFVGALAVLALFASLLMRGLRAARHAPDLFGSLLASGLTLLLVLQAFFNVAMSIGLIPTKGIPLPFFSYGGSSLLVSLCAVGILLNISRQGASPTR